MMDKTEERMRDLEQKLIKIETVNEMHLEKVSKGLENLSFLMLESDSNKEFKREFEVKVKKIIHNILESINFNNKIKEIAKNEFDLYLESRDAKKEFTEDVKIIVRSMLKDFWVRATLAIALGVGSLTYTLIEGIFK